MSCGYPTGLSSTAGPPGRSFHTLTRGSPSPPYRAPATYLDGRDVEISRATGCPVVDPWPPRWAVLEHLENPAALAAWMEADVAAEVAKVAKKHQPLREVASAGTGSRPRKRLRASSPRRSCDVYRHDRARADAVSRARNLSELGHDGGLVRSPADHRGAHPA